MRKDVFRLTVLLACAALATSRLGLIGHELIGHGGAATGADDAMVRRYLEPA